MSKRPLCVAFLWHMHQPDYRKTQTGETYLPWTRFHAVKDYYDMGALVEEAAGARVTINLVPSLIDQLEAYGFGAARELQASITLRDASALDIHEKSFLLRTFFQLSPAHMLLPYPRYRELFNRRGQPNENGEYSTGLNLYSAQDYRDLQFWYNLTWCGRELRKDPEIAAFFDKGMKFTEEDKKRLLEIQQSFIRRILPYYRRLSELNRVEFSISPYYHPILPLLCDLRAAKESLPSVVLPSVSFEYPQDAREHIDRAIGAYSRIFGTEVKGMWPSEGSISDAALELAGSAGLRWLASDESVLSNSLQREGKWSGTLPVEYKYSAYTWGQGDSGPCLFFRDHALSDLLGFSYHHWNATEAVADFLARLRHIHRHMPDNGRHYVVPVILDGENAWEHYPGNGSEFLALLYRRISEAGDMRMVTFSEFLELEPYREPLRSVVAGSWIYGNLSTWIGHPEKNRAWEHLSAARRFLKSSRFNELSPETKKSAFREIMVAEGSDWCWWYGDDHQTENAAEFDELFRSHLKNVYRFLGEIPPNNLDEPIKKIQAGLRHKNPTRTITPNVDGVVTDYFEWLSAGVAVPGGTSMHRTEQNIEKVFFGFDVQSFYLRIDLPPGKAAAFPSARSIHLQFTAPRPCCLTLERPERGDWICQIDSGCIDGEVRFAGNRILELAIPLQALGVQNSAEVTFFISILESDRELERFPSAGLIVVPTDPWGLDQQEWIV